jgi:hypothetical protein
MCVDGIHRSQGRDRLWGVVKAAMNLGVPQNAGNVLTS